jgi:iron(III) transport system substrate-binding protein
MHKAIKRFFLLRTVWLGIAGLAATVVFSSPVRGAEDVSLLLAKINKLPKEQREKALIEGAKKEGKLMFYGNWARDELEQLTNPFMQQYPFIEVLIYRGGSGKILSKLETEYRAGKHIADVILAGTSKVYPLRKAGIIGRYSSPEVQSLRPGLYDKDGWWTSVATSPVVTGYNTNLVKPDQAPKDWSDLLRPEWKGKFGLDTEPDVMMLGLLQAWGQEKMLKFVRALAQNDPQLRSGHTLLVQLLAAGEFPLAAELYGYRVAEFMDKQAPINMTYPDPTIYTVSPIMMARYAPEPHAAALFYDFVLSEKGQEILGMKIGRTPSRRNVKSSNPEFAKLQDSPKFLPLDPWLVGERTKDADRWIKEIILAGRAK